MNTRNTILAVLLLASVSGPALAHSTKPGPSQSGTNQQTGINEQTGVNKQGQAQGQSQIGINRQGQSQTGVVSPTISTSDAVSPVGSGNTTSYSEGGTTVRAEPAIAPDLAGLVGTGCMGSVSGSGAGGGFVSIGVGFTYKDSDCEKRAFAASLIALGQNAAALRLLMQNPDVAKALSDARADVAVPAVAEVPLTVQQASYKPTCTTYRKGIAVSCD